MPPGAAINQAFVENGVLVFRDQNFAGPDQFLSAASNLGDPMPPVVATYRLPGYDAIEELTNSATDKRTGEKELLYRGGSWHTDHSNLECPPKATTLYAIELPASGGGNTEFTNMAMAYGALDDSMKEKLRGRRAFQAYLSRRAPRKLLARSDAEKQLSDGVWQPLVRRHPETGRAARFISIPCAAMPSRTWVRPRATPCSIPSIAIVTAPTFSTATAGQRAIC